MLTACLGPDGRPDFAITHLEATAEEVAQRVPHALVEAALRADGYQAPFIHFDAAEVLAFLLPAVEQYLASGSHKPPG